MDEKRKGNLGRRTVGGKIQKTLTLRIRERGGAGPTCPFDLHALTWAVRGHDLSCTFLVLLNLLVFNSIKKKTKTRHAESFPHISPDSIHSVLGKSFTFSPLRALPM